MRAHVVMFVLALAAGCASSKTKQPEAPRLVDVNLVQRTQIFFGSGNSAPVSVDVSVTNNAQQEIVVRRIRLEPMMMTEYSVYPFERIVAAKLPPGQTGTVTLMLTAYTNVPRLRPMEPLSLRAIVDYDMGDKHLRDYTMDSNVAQY